MHTLVVVAHPDPVSLTHHVAHSIVDGIRSAEGGRTVEVADLSAEGFDPQFNTQDRAAYLDATGFPADVLAEQARLEHAQHLVLVFPVWWWSMPALLKGWIDRVFANGWAFGYDRASDDTIASMEGRLRWLTIHLVPIASGTERGFARHGYETALRTQIEHGVVDYCGASRGITEFVWSSENSSDDALSARADAIAAALAQGFSAGSSIPSSIAH